MKTLLIGLALALSSAVFAAEEPSGDLAVSVTANADIAYVSKYVFRGLVTDPDPAVQPSFTVTHSSGLSANFWANVDTTSLSGNKGKFTEHDYTLDYAWKCPGAGFNAGYIYYAFPNTSANSTSEFYVNATLPYTLSPSVGLHYDTDEAKGGYYVAISAGYDCSMSIPKDAPAKLSLAANIGFGSSKHNNYYFGADKTGFVDATIGASAPFYVGSMTLTPSIFYSRILDGALRAAVTDPDNWVFGLALSRDF